MGQQKLFIQKLGPGLLYAGAAIGVSHLVQSTRAGAMFGISMIGVVILAHFFKYPFFQYGPRYVAATGKSLLHGYQKLGAWALWVYFVLTLSTMFIIQGAITLVTAGLAAYITGTSWPIGIWIFILLGMGFWILSSGKLKYLDSLMKVIMVILAVTTVAAAISSLFAPVAHMGKSEFFHLNNREHWFFLIAFIGWMPAPIDISVWYSVWSETKANESKNRVRLKDALLDFSIGYWGTAVLAICFVILGTYMLRNTGIELSANAVTFSGQIIDAYANSLGLWAKPIISVAAFTTMFSTTISVMDGISRTISPTGEYIFPKIKLNSVKLKPYNAWLIVLISGTIIIDLVFAQNMRKMVDFATSLSFVTAPILAFLNIRVIQGKWFPKEQLPSMFTQYVSYIGLAFLTVFALFYIYFRFFA